MKPNAKPIHAESPITMAAKAAIQELVGTITTLRREIETHEATKAELEALIEKPQALAAVALLSARLGVTAQQEREKDDRHTMFAQVRKRRRELAETLFLLFQESGRKMRDGDIRALLMKRGQDFPISAIYRAMMDHRRAFQSNSRGWWSLLPNAALEPEEARDRT